MNFKVKDFNVETFDSILSRGLSYGLGVAGQQVCIEAAICETLGMEHSDDPKCVSPAVRAFKIRLNDSNWTTPSARAKGLRNLGLAQLGSLGVVEDREFLSRLAEKMIRILIPKLFRKIFTNSECLSAADRCETEGTKAAAAAAAGVGVAAYAAAAADAADAADAAAYAARAARAAAEAAAYADAGVGVAAYAAAAADAADAAAYAARAAAEAADAGDEYLTLSANLAFDVLKELKSPGVSLVRRGEGKMAKSKPVLTIRLGSHVPDVKIGIMAAKQTAYPVEYVRDFRRNLPKMPFKCAHSECENRIIKANPHNLCETHLWEKDWGLD